MSRVDDGVAGQRGPPWGWGRLGSALREEGTVCKGQGGTECGKFPELKFSEWPVNRKQQETQS